MSRVLKNLSLLAGVILMLILPVFTGLTLAQTTVDESKSIYYFYGQGCSHCAKVEEFFQSNSMYERYPIDSREVYFDRDNSLLFNNMMSELGIPTAQRGVPTLVLGDKVITGDSPIIDNFVMEADDYLSGNQVIDEQATVQSPDEQSTQTEAGKVSIPLIIGASLVDAINPCAFAVLIILLTTVLAKKNRKQALYSGLSFTGSVFISYMLMGLGVYAALGTLGTTNVITKIVGVIAIVIGLMNLKDWLWYGKVFLVEVPRSWRPNMKKLIGTVTSPGGAFLVGFLVSLFLLPCTSGPYLVVLGLLAQNPLDVTAIMYLLLYNLIFISPMIIITLLVYKGGDVDKIEYFRHLIAGLLLVGIGIFILL
jgi:cytochrome c biogenesis protein CcdA/glutaredoxin